MNNFFFILDELMLDKEKLQEVITSLSRQLREKDKRIEELNQSLKGN